MLVLLLDLLQNDLQYHSGVVASIVVLLWYKYAMMTVMPTIKLSVINQVDTTAAHSVDVGALLDVPLLAVIHCRDQIHWGW